MSYYIGATGEYIWEELLDNATSNVVISNNINFDANPLTDAIQQTITDALGTAVGELIAPITEVPSATGVGVVALTALGLLSYYKLNRTAVQDVDSMVYSADYASILTPGMFDDRVRIRYDSNQFSNAFYYEGGVKKGEILTSRLNLLPVDSNNIDIYTLTGKVGIGITSPSTPLHIYNATNNILRLQTAPVDGTNSIEFVRGGTTDPLNDYRLHTDTTGNFKLQYSTNTLAYGGTGSDLIHVSPTNINLYKDTEITGRLGIGTSPANTTQFHSYHATDNILRLGTATNGKVSIEFVRGAIDDVYNDFRFINQAGTFTLQYENNLVEYGNTGTDLISASSTQISIGKKTEIMGNVGIGTVPHETYKLDALGTINATAFRGNGAELTNINATNFEGTINNARLPRDISVGSLSGVGSNITNINANNITTGTLNHARFTLTGAKVFEGCEPTTFIINPSDKVDIPPVYSFNITAFDRLANTTASYLEAGKFTCTYEDRNGTYNLIPSYIPNPNNKLILNYRVGDKITFKHTANTTFDYTEVPEQRWAKLSIFRIASNIAWTSQGQETYMNRLVEWFSDSPNVIDYTSGTAITYPRNTPVMIQIQANFKYFLIKWQRNDDTNIFDSYITPATEASGMNIEFGGGQGFKILGDYSGSGGYKPMSSSLPPLMTADTEGTARRGSRLSIDNGVLSADIPTSADLITNMNTAHFTNNTGTSKIDISSSYVAPNATKLATSRNIAGVGFDGTGNIDIPYANLSSIPSTWSVSQIPDLGAGKITSGIFSTDRIPDLGAGKITSGTFADARIPNLDTGKITTGTFADARIPDLATTKITTGTFADARIPDLATTKITSGTFDVLRIPDLATTKITSGTFDVLRIPDLATSKITTGTFDVLRIPDLGAAKINSGTFDVLRIPDLAISKITGLQGALDGKQATINSTAGQLIIGNGNGLTTTNTGLTFSGSTLTANNLTISTNLVVNASAGIVGTSQFTGNVGIGTTSHATYKVDVNGTLNATSLLVNGTAITGGSKWTTATDTTRIYYNTGNVGIGTTNPLTKLHINDTTTNTTTLTIQNNFTSGGAITATPTATGTVGAYTTMVFTYTTGTSDTSYTITAGGVVCDILIVGGGGGGGAGHGGGGGAGQLILIHQATLNGTYTIKVGKGGNGAILTSGGSLTSGATKGSNSEFGNTSINVIAEGGGANGGATLKDGGSGSGGDGYTPDSGVAGKGLKNTTIDTFSSGTVYSRGNDGGDGNNAGGGGQGGGGGGAGAVGTTGGNNVNTTIGHGGDGLSGISAISYDFKTNFGNYGKLETDGNYWFAGGGAGGIYYTTAGVVSNGGKGGGGSTPPNVGSAKNDGGSGVNGTGGGGAGGSAFYGSGGNGGSGIVIIRYLTPSSSSTIELLRGTTTDANHDWKLGNYNGDFKAISSVSGVDTDRLVISSAGNVGIGTTNPQTLLDIRGTSPTIKLLDTRSDGDAVIQFRESSDLFGIDIAYIGNLDNKMYIRAFNNSATAVNHVAIDRANGNVSIGTSDTATYKLVVNGSSFFNGVMNFNTLFNGGGANFACNKINLWGNAGNYGFGISSGTLDYFSNSAHSWWTGSAGTSFGTQRMLLNTGGLNVYNGLNVSGATIIGGQLRVQGNNLVINGTQPTIFFRDSDQKQGMIHVNSGLMYFLSGPASNSSDSAADWATNFGEWPLILNLNTNDARFGGEIRAIFIAVNRTDTDYLCVQTNYSAIGVSSSQTIKVAFGSFTGFHRCYTDDELYGETDEDKDIFKNNYIGRVVIATGKIKTDFTRKKAKPEPVAEVIVEEVVEADEPEPIPEPIPTGSKQKEEDEWYSEIDKDGITIEDAVPVVRLSRQRKDKRVFGVFGGIRSTNNKDRLIVNSVGEGGICVSNTNGNIENGDLLQTSDLLGYAEKQDDDIIRSYTIGKATIDCNFELDSPYYQIHEIENGVRVAFIACSYCCG